MATLTFDDRSFLLDGKRVWLVSGSVHYFRTPSGLWRDRLLKAKRAGLNCIDTYVAWNLHEPVEGKWDFSGDLDVAAFVRLAGELGLFVILRPGPYICAEWDFGGLPAWLAAKSGIAYRTNNAVYTHYYDKYFRQLLPRLAEQQATRGGNILLIQNENEYGSTLMPDRLNYLEFISRLIRRYGFDIPIVTCNWLSEPFLPDAVECVNGYADVVPWLKRLRSRQKNAPLLVTEFWPGWFDSWGGEHQRRDPREVSRLAVEMLGCGAQFNYYMWHGGTNFAFWGSRLNESGHSYQTTSYDYDAPLAEGGGLTRKYYLTRLVNMLAGSMGRFLADAASVPGVSVRDCCGAAELAGPLAHWAVVTSGGRKDVQTARISLQNGRELTVSLEPLGAGAFPYDCRLTDEHTLDYCNLMPLGFFGGRILVLHGPAGWDARLSLSGKEFAVKVPEGEEPTVIEHAGLQIVLANSELAMRTWLVDDQLVFGPRYVGEKIENIVGEAKQYAVMPLEGAMTHAKHHPAAAKASLPRLGAWKRVHTCMEPLSADLSWQPIERPPCDVDRLGAHHGYLWYRIELEQPKVRRRNLFLPGCEDRAAIFLNGAPVGTWGRMGDATRRPIPVTMRRGPNVLTLLADNLGRFNYGNRIGELKGLFGHVYDAQRLTPSRVSLKPQPDFSRKVVPRQLSHLMKELERGPIWLAEFEFPLKSVVPIHLAFADLPHHAAVLCNERAVGFYAGPAANFGDATLGSELEKGRNKVSVLLWGEVAPEELKKFQFYALSECLTETAKWSCRAWQSPEPQSKPSPRRGFPAWYAAKFKGGGEGGPLFARFDGNLKGQLFINGHNAGRVWTLGPQRRYYLPECWLAGENEIVLFEEQGRAPMKVALESCPAGPYAED